MLRGQYLSPKQCRTGLKTRGFVEIPRDREFIRRLLKDACEGFNRLLKDPRRNTFRVAPALWEHDELGEEYELGLLDERCGALKKNPSAQEIAEGRLTEDPDKIIFHWNVRLADYLHGNGAPIQEYEAFLNALQWFTAAAHRIALQIVPEELASRLWAGPAITRLQRYGSTPRKMGAAFHRDRSFLTIHWWASHLGLVLWDWAGERIAVRELSPEWICAFTGLKWWGFTKGAERALLHGAQDPALSGAAQRYSLVSFIHGALTPDEVGWMQEHLPSLAV